MATVRDIYHQIDAVAPFADAMDFDNTGILVGDAGAEVQTVLFALDIQPQVVKEAVALGAQLIISHHPVIFKPLRQLDTASVPYLLARHGIAAIGCHTNLDVAPEYGVNVCLAKRLGLHELRGAKVYRQGFSLFTAELDTPVSPVQFARLVKDRLQADQVQFVHGTGEIKKVALCSGAGGSEMHNVMETGAQAYLTGELRHDEWITAGQMGITVLAAGHYDTEKWFADLLCGYLQEAFPQMNMVISAQDKPQLELLV